MVSQKLVNYLLCIEEILKCKVLKESTSLNMLSRYLLQDG